MLTTIEDRLERIRNIIEEHYDDNATAMLEVLTDLRHLADADDLDFDETVTKSRFSFEVDVEDAHEELLKASGVTNTYEVQGYHGTDNACTIFVAETDDGTWYCTKGSVNINCTCDPVVRGVNVEDINDGDTGTAGAPVESIEALVRELAE